MTNSNIHKTAVSKTDNGLKTTQWNEDQEQYWEHVMMKSRPVFLIDDNTDYDDKIQILSSTFSLDKKLP